MNPFDLIKNLKNMQSKMGEMQEQIKNTVVTGSAGGGMATVEMNGHMEILKLTIAPEVVDPEDIKMIEDLVTAAFNDALVKVKKEMQEKMTEATGGMNIPPGMMGM